MVVYLLNAGGFMGESLAWMHLWWENFYLRGGVLWDLMGSVASGLYGQPDTHHPFGRGFIIDQQGNVDRAYFGFDPAMIIERIYTLLGTTAVPDEECDPDEAVDGTVRPAATILRVTNYPNPFNPRTMIAYESSAPGPVDLRVFDLTGRLIRVLATDVTERPGWQRTLWDGRDDAGCDVAAGVYVVRVAAQRSTLYKAVTLVR